MEKKTITLSKLHSSTSSMFCVIQWSECINIIISLSAKHDTYMEYITLISLTNIQPNQICSASIAYSICHYYVPLCNCHTSSWDAMVPNKSFIARLFVYCTFADL